MIVIEAGTRSEVFLEEQLTALLDSGANERCFALGFECEQYFLPGKPRVSLLALVALQCDRGAPRIRLSLHPRTPDFETQVNAVMARASELEALAQRWAVPWFTLGEPLALAPLVVPKPWGREVWYTGIEARGQASVRVAGGQIPLHWLLAFAPSRLVASHERRLILLKRLEPWADPQLGDLYFEMHEQKREVYLVTRVDESLWPGGQGGIRLGFNPQKRARYADDQTFKADYLRAVQAYQSVRRELDARLDQWRVAQGLDLNLPLHPEQYRAGMEQVDPALKSCEQERRSIMESYTAVRPVRRGDVVRVPPYTPHALLHGVEVVEFQTPHYERKILSFNQKVLTQDHWDTVEALPKLSLDTPAQHPPRAWTLSPGQSLEQLAEFSQFSVFRLRLKAGESFPLRRLQGFVPASDHPRYNLLMVLCGDPHYSHSPQAALAPGEVHLLPSGRGNLVLSCQHDTEVLLSIPGCPSVESADSAPGLPEAGCAAY